MKKSSFVLCGLILALSGCSGVSNDCSPDNFVRALKPEQQFKRILTGVVGRTQTFAAHNASDSNFAEKLSSAVDTVANRHSERWIGNMVSSWSKLSTEDMKNACAALQSRDEAAFTVYASKVAADIQTLNEPLLKQAGVEVLQITEGT